MTTWRILGWSLWSIKINHVVTVAEGFQEWITPILYTRTQTVGFEHDKPAGTGFTMTRLPSPRIATRQPA